MPIGLNLSLPRLRRPGSPDDPVDGPTLRPRLTHGEQFYETPDPLAAEKYAPTGDGPALPGRFTGNPLAFFGQQPPDAPSLAPPPQDDTFVADNGPTLRPRLADAPVGDPNPLNMDERRMNLIERDQALMGDPNLRNDPDNRPSLKERLLVGAFKGIEAANQAAQQAAANHQQLSAGQALAPIAGGVGGALLSPKGTADILHQRELDAAAPAQARFEAEAARRLQQRQVEANIRHVDADTNAIPVRAASAQQKQQQASVLSAYGKFQSFDPDDPANSAFVQQYTDVMGFPPQKKDVFHKVQNVHDERTGDWSAIITDTRTGKQETVPLTIDGQPFKTQSTAQLGDAGQDRRQGNQIRSTEEIQRENRDSREKIAAMNVSSRAQLQQNQLNSTDGHWRATHPGAGIRLSQQDLITKAQTLQAADPYKGTTKATPFGTYLNRAHQSALTQGYSIEE